MKITKGRLLSKVKLEGKDLHTYEDSIIDTGASFTIVPPEIADYLELEPHKEISKTRLITASGLIKAPVKVLTQLVVGSVEIKNMPVVVHEIPDPSPIKVLLGMNFILRSTIYINGKEQEFTVEDP